MRELIDHIITKVEIGDNQTMLVFTDGNGERYFYETTGYCCSISWFSHITGLTNLLNQRVNEVKERYEFTDEEQKLAEEEYKKENNYNPESLQLYGIMLKTDKGTCDIEFRNESNGYYGGSCEYIGDNGQEKELKEAMQGIEYRDTDAFLDEIPQAYKDIDQVMEDAKDLVEIKHTLK